MRNLFYVFPRMQGPSFWFMDDSACGGRGCQSHADVVMSFLRSGLLNHDFFIIYGIVHFCLVNMFFGVGAGMQH